MAVKHIIDYYDKVCSDYTEMLNTLNDMEDAFNQNMVSEEQLNQVKKMIEPIKQNYMTLSWIIYLLNQPTRKEKEKGYERRMKKFTSQLDSNRNMSGVLKENKETIFTLKNYRT